MSTTPCFITADYLKSLKDSRLLEKEDAAKISQLTKERQMRSGKGYKAGQVRNFLFHGHTMTIEMMTCITDYFEAKLQMRKELLTKQQKFIATLQQVQEVA
jgi:hypothetical protein